MMRKFKMVCDEITTINYINKKVLKILLKSIVFHIVKKYRDNTVILCTYDVM